MILDMGIWKVKSIIKAEKLLICLRRLAVVFLGQQLGTRQERDGNQILIL